MTTKRDNLAAGLIYACALLCLLLWLYAPEVERAVCNWWSP